MLEDDDGNSDKDQERERSESDTGIKCSVSLDDLQVDAETAHASVIAEKKTLEALAKAEAQEQDWLKKTAKETTKEALLRAQQEKLQWHLTELTSSPIDDTQKAEKFAEAAKEQGQSIFTDSIVEFKSDFPHGNFEQFLFHQWPQDYKIFQRWKANDPSITRSYTGWQRTFKEESEEWDRIQMVKAANLKVQEAMARAAEESNKWKIQVAQEQQAKERSLERQFFGGSASPIKAAMDQRLAEYKTKSANSTPAKVEGGSIAAFSPLQQLSALWSANVGTPTSGNERRRTIPSTPDLSTSATAATRARAKSSPTSDALAGYALPPKLTQEQADELDAMF
jgi:hypothetical protein